MEYRLKKISDELVTLPCPGLSGNAQRLLFKLLCKQDGVGVGFNGEVEFVELERAGYLRLATIHRRLHSGEVVVSNRVCHVAPSPCWPLPELDPGLFIGLPFDLPKTQASSAWLAEMDFVDPYDGDLSEVRGLAATAPSASAHDWLNGLIAARERLAMAKLPI